MRKLIKVCGMRDAENIRSISALDIDLMGFIFYPPSSRCVTELPSFMPSAQKRVGVFVNAGIDEIASRHAQFHFDYIQLHGKESPDLCRELRSMGLGVIKAFSLKGEEDVERTAAYEGACDYFLFDTPTKLVGGSGEQFDWTLLDAYKGRTPFLLSGGIGPDSVEKLKAFSHPMLAGYDINSRFETAPALKNVQAVQNFIDSVFAICPFGGSASLRPTTASQRSPRPSRGG